MTNYTTNSSNKLRMKFLLNRWPYQSSNALMMCKQTTKRFTQRKLSDLTTLHMKSESQKDSWFLEMTLLYSQRCGTLWLQTALFTLRTQHQDRKLKWGRLFKGNTMIYYQLTGDQHSNHVKISFHGPVTSKIHFWKIKMHLKTSFGTAKTQMHWSLSSVQIMIVLRQSLAISEHFREND